MRQRLIQNPWSGRIYNTWEEACAAAETRLSDFTQERWLQRITDQLIDYRTLVSEVGVAANPPRPSNLSLVASLIGATSIIDFGGSSGWCYEMLNNTYKAASKLHYTVIETEEVVCFLRGKKLHSGKNINFCTQTDIKKNCEYDLFYSNSVLQYFEDNQKFLDILERLSPKFVYLEDLYAGCLEKDFFSLQNYYEYQLAHRFLSLGKLENELKKLGYIVKQKQPYMSPIYGRIDVLPMENFPEEYRLHRTLSVLFELAK